MTHDEAAPQPLNGFAIASLVFGGLSLLVAWIPFLNLAVLIPAIAGLVLGIIGLRKTGGRGLAIGGIIVSALSLVLIVAVLGLVGLFVAAFAGG